MKIANETLKNIDEQIKRKIDLKENELENINKIYEKRIEEANSLGDEKYVESVDKNKQRVILANKEYEEKLQTYQDSLSKVKSNIEVNQDKAIKSYKEDQHNLKTQSEEKYSKIYNNALENEEDLFRKSQNDSRQLDLKSQSEKARNEFHVKQSLAAFSGELTQNTREQEEHLKQQLDTEQKDMSSRLVQNKMDTQARLLESNSKNKRMEDEQKRVQESQLSFQDKYHNDLIKQKQDDFQVRYQALSSQHQEILDNLTAKLNKTTEAAIATHVKEKKSITDVSNDPFYQLDILKPKISEDIKNYYVNLEIPLHEKENVHLMAHGREIRITMSRKYASSLEDEDGAINRTSKTQLYSKEFPTKDILNSKLISQKYENGILSFKVAKL